jgi:hypothetical protein
LVFVGYSRETLAAMEAWRQIFFSALTAPDPAMPAKKIFSPKYELPPIADYTVAQPPAFWACFPSSSTRVGKSWVDAAALEDLATSAGYPFDDVLAAVCSDLQFGADIGCRGVFRDATFSSNAPSAFDFAAEITDAVAGWVAKGIAAGPFDPCDRPAGVKVNGIMCRAKPNGSARIILNMSAPAGQSVNDGIDKDLFPTKMSSTGKWLEVLNSVGRRCQIMKVDWSDAYKHVHVRPADLPLQWFSWLGKDFYELGLIFGTSSSAGIFDRLAKIVLHIALHRAKFPARLVCQHLDDVCAAAAQGSMALHAFAEAYRSVAEQLGVRLAPTTDPDKAFLPCTAGTVLGVFYDTAAWTWQIPAEKLARLINQIRAVLGVDAVRQDEIWSLCGRILHYAPLIPGGRFNINYILAANCESPDRAHLVTPSALLKRQLHFWLLTLKATAGHCSIPAVPRPLPAWAAEYFTDAAGGSLESAGRGCGGVRTGFWFFLPWPRKINCGVKFTDGKKLSRKLSALELVGPLVCLSADFARCRNTAVRAWVDNIGSVTIWQKGYSTRCDLCNTLVKAIATVAAAAGCQFSIEKITRCSSPGAVLADALSKASFQPVWAARADWQLPLEPASIPPPLLTWLASPCLDDDLGDKILCHLRRSQLILGYNC